MLRVVFVDLKPLLSEHDPQIDTMKKKPSKDGIGNPAIFNLGVRIQLGSATDF
jgi:hypothetical protein